MGVLVMQVAAREYVKETRDIAANAAIELGMLALEILALGLEVDLPSGSARAQVKLAVIVEKEGEDSTPIRDREQQAAQVIDDMRSDMFRSWNGQANKIMTER